MTGTVSALETEWIEKAKAGDLAAFSELIKQHEEKMLHAAFSFTGSREDAKDLAQEAFVKAYGAIRQFKGGSRFSTWLYRILANQCKDFLRKKTVRKNLLGARPADEDEYEESPEDRLPSPAADARQVAEQKEIAAAIREAMEELPLQQKNVFVMRYLEGLSLLEIAEILKLSEGAVKAHLWQAGQKMQKSLQSWRKL